MTLKTQIAADMAAVFFNTDEFAETITYNGEEIPAIVDYGEHPYESDAALKDAATIYVNADEVPDPVNRDAVEINGASWEVAEAPAGADGNVWQISIVRNVRPQISRRR